MAFAMGTGWIFLLILVAVIVIVVELIKKKQAVATKMAMIVMIFLVLSVGYVFLANNIELNSMSSLVKGTGIYFNWLGTLFNNAVDITSYVIKMDWATNSSIAK